MLNKYIAEYFFRARDIVSKHNPQNTTVVQFFQRKNDTVLSGMDEALELLRDKLKGTGTIVRYLPEGSMISDREVVLEIEGNYQVFGIYEGLVDGILARATSIATNAYQCLKASRGKEIICMSDRSDHYSNHQRDGLAMYTAGIRSFSCFSQVPPGKESECIVYGSIPHALIQNFKGDLVKVMEHYDEMFPDEALVALVDFHNDVISDSLQVLRKLKGKLKGVRIDTSGNMRDAMFKDNENEFGVTPNQVKRLRAALDAEEFGKDVKIFVSSGFTPEKIAKFEEEGTPVDGYGVGEFMLTLHHTFSADAVKIDGQCLAKEGRKYNPNSRLQVCQM